MVQTELALASESLDAEAAADGISAFMARTMRGVLLLRSWMGLSVEAAPALLRFRRLAGRGWQLLYRRVEAPALPASTDPQAAWRTLDDLLRAAEAEAEGAEAPWLSGGVVSELVDASESMLRKRSPPKPQASSRWLLRQDQPLYVSIRAAELPGGHARFHVSAMEYVRLLAWASPVVAAEYVA